MSFPGFGWCCFLVWLVLFLFLFFPLGPMVSQALHDREQKFRSDNLLWFDKPDLETHLLIQQTQAGEQNNEVPS